MISQYGTNVTRRGERGGVCPPVRRLPADFTCAGVATSENELD